MSTEALALRELSEPWEAGEKIKSAIDRAARRSGLSFWRAYDIWYGKARRIRDFERAQISSALQAKREKDAKNELHHLKTRLAVLEARLRAGDTDFHRPAASELGKARGRRG